MIPFFLDASPLVQTRGRAVVDSLTVNMMLFSNACFIPMRQGLTNHIGKKLCLFAILGYCKQLEG